MLVEARPTALAKSLVPVPGVPTGSFQPFGQILDVALAPAVVAELHVPAVAAHQE